MAIKGGTRENRHRRWMEQFYVWMPNDVEGICLYCGNVGWDVEHMWPISAGLEGAWETMYMCHTCRECNAIVGNYKDDSPYDRIIRVKDHLEWKYRKVLDRPSWRNEELNELGPSLRHCVEAGLTHREWINDRLHYMEGIKAALAMRN